MAILLILCLWFGQSQDRAAESQAPTNTQQQSAPGVFSPAPSQNAGESGNERQQRQNDAARWSDPIVLLQLLLFFAVAVQAGIYVWQAVLMRRTLRVLGGQAETFEAQTATMEKQFKLAVFESTQQRNAHRVEMKNMELQAEVMRGQLAAMQEAAEMAKGQLVAMQHQEQAMFQSLDALKAQTEHSQRAYVCIPAANMDVVEELGSRNQVMVFALRVDNTGNSPANNVQITGVTGLDSEVPGLAYVAKKETVTLGLIAPKAHARQWFRAPELSSEENQRWVGGEIEVYCSGIITYESFGKTRTTKFCFMRKPGTMHVGVCSSGNEAD